MEISISVNRKNTRQKTDSQKGIRNIKMIVGIRLIYSGARFIIVDHIFF